EQSLHRGSLHKSQVLTTLPALPAKTSCANGACAAPGAMTRRLRPRRCRASAASTKDGIAATGQRVGAADCGHRRVEDALNLLHIFYTANALYLLSCSTPKKLTQKLTRQAQEPLMLASLALPDWCDLRLQLFHCVAFGPTRALMWIQAQKRRAQELQQGQTKRPVREDQLPLGEPICGSGRLKRERVRIPRLSGDPLLAWLLRLLDTHAARKAELEVQFDGEQGTGLGPTLEFFSLLAAEFTAAIWAYPNADEAEDAVAEDGKPVGYYVTRPAFGLFFRLHIAPARPQGGGSVPAAGMSLAKCLQDGRLMDVSLSTPLLRLLCQAQEPGDRELQCRLDFACLLSGAGSSLINRWSLSRIGLRWPLSWRTCVWTASGCPLLGVRRDCDTSAAPAVRLRPQRSCAPLATLFEASPEPVTLSNLAEFAALTRQYALDTGLRAQLEALKNGFDSVFPMHRLKAVHPEESWRSLLWRRAGARMDQRRHSGAHGAQERLP
uniref:E3 ubiquitin-protein ligase n=1 Tax=Macrostomum lignano TaxID=282301 RepID=A0A1I8JMN7_9PLAT